jgi:H/ACA ribonucleoprotein complex subunit 4
MTMEVVRKEEEHVIKPQAVAPAIDTSQWPLLLKNYEKRACTLCIKAK